MLFINLIFICITLLNCTFTLQACAIERDNKGTYQLSDDYERCFKQKLDQGKTMSMEIEGECLKQEFEKMKKRFLITLDLIVYSRETFSKRDSANKENQKRSKETIFFLRRSSMDFINFIEKYCAENSKHYSSRMSYWIYYYDMMILLNTRFDFLENQCINLFSDFDYQGLDKLLTSILNEILTSSNHHQQLTYEQNQKIDIFFKLSKILDRPEFQKETLIFLLDRLKKDYIKDRNLIALSLYNKMKLLKHC